MKTLFTLLALASVASVSARSSGHYYQTSYGTSPYYENSQSYGDSHSYGDSYGYYQNYGGSSCPTCPTCPSYSSYDSDGGYYQRDGRNYQRTNQYNQYDYQHDYQQSTRDSSYDANQGYYQPQASQSYDRDQQRNYDNNNYGSQKGNDVRSASDQEINTKIRDALGSGWFSKGYENVSYDVNNGNVTLRGSVDTIENKNKVEESVRKIDGVRQVNNQITVDKNSSGTYSDSQRRDGYSDSQKRSDGYYDSQKASDNKYSQDHASNSQDRELNAKIRDKLGSGWFSKGYDTVVIRTTNGVVTISGTVDKHEDITKISEQIRSVDGVRSVNNQLTAKNR